MRNDLTRELVMAPAWDRRNEGDGRYGQHCAEQRWYLKGLLGAIQFILFTGWGAGMIVQPDAPWQELHIKNTDRYNFNAPLPADLGYHSPTPRYENQHAMDCHVLPEGKCYYDGSGLNADRIFSILIHKGGEAVWEALEEYYAETFEAQAEEKISTAK
jgi:hypothetical protein